MPQMAPLNWLSLMITFALILLAFNVLNYFSFSNQIKQTSTEVYKPKTAWKW